MNLSGLKNSVYVIEDKPFSSGGEGDIYNLIGYSEYVIKIYHNDRNTFELEQKLRYMVNNPPASNILNQVAWPLDLVYDQTGFRGFLMPKLDIHADLTDIYQYPQLTPISQMSYRNKLVIAMNICTVIDAVHKAGYIFGDFNPNNIGINLNSGKVAFLDTDSYHIVLDEKNNKAYRCTVCFDGYVAPELIQKCERYKKDAYALAPLPTFTKETDNFALAIHMFKLLMNGFTPFNGIKEGERASSASPGVGNQAIKRNEYCFKPGNKPLSPAVPPVDILSKRIKRLFTKAFLYGKNHPSLRPDAKEWYKAIDEYDRNLKACQKNSNHYYKKGLRECPWCKADENYQNEINQSNFRQRQFPTPISPTIGSAKVTTTTRKITVTPSSQVPLTTSSPSSVPSNIRKNWFSDKGRILYPMSFFFILASIGLSIYPFFKTGSFVHDNSVYIGINFNLYLILNLISVAFFCFSEGLKVGHSTFVIFITFVWSFICSYVLTLVRITQLGIAITNIVEILKTFNILLASFVLTLDISGQLGDCLKEFNSNNFKPYLEKFKLFDYIVIGTGFILSIYLISFLIDLPKFYATLNTDKILYWGLYIVPVLLILIYFFSGNNSLNFLGKTWFCTTIIVFFECDLLRLLNTDLMTAFFGWAALGIIGLCYLSSFVNEWMDSYFLTRMSTISMFTIFFTSTTFILIILAVANGNMNAIGFGYYGLAVEPAILTFLLAVVITINILVHDFIKY